jgi:hypothetical protein
MSRLPHVDENGKEKENENEEEKEKEKGTETEKEKCILRSVTVACYHCLPYQALCRTSFPVQCSAMQCSGVQCSRSAFRLFVRQTHGKGVWTLELWH